MRTSCFHRYSKQTAGKLRPFTRKKNILKCPRNILSLLNCLRGARLAAIIHVLLCSGESIMLPPSRVSFPENSRWRYNCRLQEYRLRFNCCSWITLTHVNFSVGVFVEQSKYVAEQTLTSRKINDSASFLSIQQNLGNVSFSLVWAKERGKCFITHWHRSPIWDLGAIK